MRDYDKDRYIREQQAKTTELEQSIKELAGRYKNDPALFQEILEFESRFYQYSARNTLLIYKQNQYASFVDSYKGFERNGYHVKRGQHGIKIFVPVKATLLKIVDDWIKLSDATTEQKRAYQNKEVESRTVLRYKIGTVFDISQTDCPASEYPRLYHVGYDSAQHGMLYDAVKEYARQTLQCPVLEEDLQSIALRGRYLPDTNQIQINDKLQDTERLSTLTHELAHAEMHRLDDVQKSSAQIEFEADSLSIMLYSYLGLEISESRQRHLAENFKGVPDVDTVLSNVSEHYRKMLPKLAETIDLHIAPQEDRHSIEPSTIPTNNFSISM